MFALPDAEIKFCRFTHLFGLLFLDHTEIEDFVAEDLFGHIYHFFRDSLAFLACNVLFTKLVCHILYLYCNKSMYTLKQIDVIWFFILPSDR